MVMKVNMNNEKHHEVKVYCAINNYQIQAFVHEAVTEKMERDKHE